jgi:hypothetical protein
VNGSGRRGAGDFSLNPPFRGRGTTPCGGDHRKNLRRSPRPTYAAKAPFATESDSETIYGDENCDRNDAGSRHSGKRIEASARKSREDAPSSTL